MTPPLAVEEVAIAPSPGGRIARELCSLALLAFAAFGTVSLVSVDLGRSPNLGGPVGAAIAATLGGLVGYESYTAMILVAWLAQRVWTGAGIVTIAREIGGGALLILALATAGALWNLHDLKMGGALGATSRHAAERFAQRRRRADCGRARIDLRARPDAQARADRVDGGGRQ